MYAIASASSVNVSLPAQATPYLRMNAFDKSLLASSWAPALQGPTVGMPAFQNKPAMPSASGFSGPITARVHPSCSAIFTYDSFVEYVLFLSQPQSAGAMFTHFDSNAVPPFPGMQTTFSTE